MRYQADAEPALIARGAGSEHVARPVGGVVHPAPAHHLFSGEPIGSRRSQYAVLPASELPGSEKLALHHAPFRFPARGDAVIVVRNARHQAEAHTAIREE